MTTEQLQKFCYDFKLNIKLNATWSNILESRFIYDFVFISGK